MQKLLILFRIGNLCTQNQGLYLYREGQLRVTMVETMTHIPDFVALCKPISVVLVTKHTHVNVTMRPCNMIHTISNNEITLGQ
jgi:hypothetical protein